MGNLKPVAMTKHKALNVKVLRENQIITTYYLASHTGAM